MADSADISLRDLAPDPANPRVISADNEQRLLRSMETYGDLANPTFNKRLKKMVGGHQRIRLLRRQYGQDAVSIRKVGPDDYRLEVRRFDGDAAPIVLPLRVVDWDEKRHAAAMVAANSPDVRGEYDTTKIRDVYEMLGEGYDVSLTAVSAETIEEWTAPEDGDAEAQNDDVPAVDPSLVAKWNPTRGAVWDLLDESGQLRHRVMCGDSESATDVAMLLDGAEPNLCVTDPPYGVNYDPSWRARAGVNTNTIALGKVQNDDRADFREAWRLAPADVFYVYCGSLHLGAVKASLNACKIDCRSLIIWNKNRFALSRGHYHWKHETCWYGVRVGGQSRWTGGRDKCTVWDIDSIGDIQGDADEEQMGHGTQKPVECMARAIRNHDGDVYDPFAGSGTTLIAAHQLGRRSWCMDIDADYCAVVLERASRQRLEVVRAA